MRYPIFHALPNPAFVLDEGRKIAFINKNAIELFGDNYKNIEGLPFENLLENNQEVFKILLKNSDEWSNPNTNCTFDCAMQVGDKKVSVQLLLSDVDLDGKNFHLVQISRTYIPREVEAKKMIDINRRLRFIVDNMLEGVQIMTDKFEYLYLNDTAVRHSQTTREELLGKTFQEMYPGVEKTEIFRVMKQCVEDQLPRQLENEFRFPNNKIGWFQLSIQPMGDLLFILSIDITEVRRSRLIVRKQNEELKTKTAEVLKFQSQLLSTQINPHFIFNVLNSIQNFVLHEETEPALMFISDFAILMRTMLNSSQKPYVSIAESVDFLNLYLKLEQRRLKNKFNYSIRISEGIDADEIMIPPMILQPYIENTIVHGVGHLTSGGMVQLEISQEGDMLICNITDNGIGRKESQRLAEKFGSKKFKSMALEITEKRLALLSELECKRCSVEIDDVYDHNGDCMGTKVKVQLPIISGWDMN